MRKWNVGLIVPLVLLFTLAGCGKNSAIIDKVNVYKMVSFSITDEESLITYSDSSLINIFINAFNNGNRVPGIADVVDPKYKVELGDQTYFLWIHQDSGSMMKTDDTNALYTLTKSSARKIYELLKE